MRSPYLSSALQFSEELSDLLEFYEELFEELGVEAPEDLQERVSQAIAICKRSVREAREHWQTPDI